MPSTFRLALLVVLVLGTALPAGAQELTAPPDIAPASIEAAVTQEAASAPPPKAVEYSDAYQLRAKVHKMASFATLPLFGAQAYLGQSIYNNPTDGKRSAHTAVATGIGVLFGVNSVTGVWNLVEARNDPNGRALRWTHGLLMLGSDAGFLATAMTAPGEHEGGGDRSLHRTIAFTSIGAATAGYLVMLVAHH